MKGQFMLPLDDAFQETSCSTVIQISCRFRRKAVYISVKTIAARAEGTTAY
jgi:hypothetical protein